MDKEAIVEFKNKIDDLIKEAYELLPDLIKETRSSDDTAKSWNAKWTERHRLHVLLEVAELSSKQLKENVVVAPWFLPELKATLDVIRIWKDDPIWKEIEPSLKNKTKFRHTVGKLQIAELFKKEGHDVKLFPADNKASPDLRLKALGDSQDWVYIECYQPVALMGRAEESSQDELNNIVKNSMNKAKRQFENRNPGILAIFGYNQSRRDFYILTQKIATRLDKTNRPYLAGMLIMIQDVFVKKIKGNTIFQSIVSVNYVSNPSYFGRVDIQIKMPKNGGIFEHGHIISVKANNFLEKKSDELSEIIKEEKSWIKPIIRITRKKRLKIIKEPEQKSRVLIRRENKGTFPLFKGLSNINFLCGKCNTILAECAWNLSLSNIVAQCPSCKAYNGFPTVEYVKYPIKGKIPFKNGTYNILKWIELKQGVMLVGI